MAAVINETRGSLLKRRAQILGRLGVTAEEFDALLRSAITLSGDEWAARDELEEIAFLLGE